MARWPPLLWLCIALGSLFLLMGWNGNSTHPVPLVVGIVLIVAGVAGSVWLAFGRWGGRPQAGLAWLVPATLAFYIVCAALSLIAGSRYAVAAMIAGLVPFTAATLLTATNRAKTVTAGDARRETTAGESQDPFPGIGSDDETPFGDTPEHSTAERVAPPGDYGRG